MAPKQATLGYVKFGQSTIGCVEGQLKFEDPTTDQGQLITTGSSLGQKVRLLNRQSSPSAANPKKKK